MYFKAGILSLLVVTSLAFGEGVEGSKPPNVLFVMVDDLRVELGAYGGEHVLSPNIDELAGQGTRFANAYVSVPVCGASRASLFTGMRATPDRFTNYYTWVEKDAPDATTIFEHITFVERIMRFFVKKSQKDKKRAYLLDSKLLLRDLTLMRQE